MAITPRKKAEKPQATIAARKGHWIKGAVKHPGAFTRKAQAAGMSVEAYAEKVTRPGSTADATTKRQANLAKLFRRFTND